MRTPQTLPAEDAAHGQPNGAAQILFPAMQRLDGNRRRPLDPDEHRAVNGRPNLGGQSAADERVATL